LPIQFFWVGGEGLTVILPKRVQHIYLMFG
jgi:hypothetical protein